MWLIIALQGDEEGENGEDGEDDIDQPVGALPRRMSLMRAKTKVRPIPEATSLFVFKSTNR